MCEGGQEKLPGSLLFGSENPLPRGSVVIAHSEWESEPIWGHRVPESLQNGCGYTY